MLTMVTGALYLAWLWFALNWQHPVVASAFMGAELVSFALFVLAAAGAWRMRFKPLETPLPVAPTSVDVLITVCGEPLPVVTRTVAAAAAGPRLRGERDDIARAGARPASLRAPSRGQPGPAVRTRNTSARTIMQQPLTSSVGTSVGSAC